MTEENEHVSYFMNSAMDPSIRKQLAMLYFRMNTTRTKKNMHNITDPGLRRCNRCEKYFPVSETILRKYYSHSNRKYRLCNSCATLYNNSDMLS